MKLPKLLKQNKHSEEFANTLIKKSKPVFWLPSLPQESFKQNKETERWEIDGYKYWFYQPGNGLPPFEVKTSKRYESLPEDIVAIKFEHLSAVRIKDDVYFKCEDFIVLEGGK